MLENFTLSATFYETRVRLYVEIRLHGPSMASCVITQDRVIVSMSDVRATECGSWRSVAEAEAWMRRPMGERGNFVEWAHWMASNGLFRQAA